MNRLLVYWNLHSMSDAVAAKGKLGNKKYKTVPMRSEFPETISPEEAINLIFNKYGERPIAADSICVGHKFAEIRYWKYAPVFTREAGVVEKVEQPPLFDLDQYTTAEDAT